MTNRLYNEDSYIKSFHATVVSCTPYKEKMYQVVLDRTAFFSEGGGQSGDTGFLWMANAEASEGCNKVRVIDVRDSQEEVFHITDSPIEVGIEKTHLI